MIFLPLNNGEVFKIKEDAKSELFDLLLAKTKALGHRMSFHEAIKDPDMVNPNQYAYYFESFDVAAKMAWYQLQDNSDDTGDGYDKKAEIVRKRIEETKEQQLREKTQQDLKNQKKPFSLKPLYKSEPGKTQPDVTTPHKKARSSSAAKENAEKILRSFYQEYGRVPSAKECNSHMCGLPSYQIMHKYFGAKGEWLHLARMEGSYFRLNPVEDEAAQIIKEYPIRKGEPLKIHFGIDKFDLIVAIPADNETVKVIFTKK